METIPDPERRCLPYRRRRTCQLSEDQLVESKWDERKEGKRRRMQTTQINGRVILSSLMILNKTYRAPHNDTNPI